MVWIYNFFQLRKGFVNKVPLRNYIRSDLLYLLCKFARARYWTCSFFTHDLGKRANYHEKRAIRTPIYLVKPATEHAPILEACGFSQIFYGFPLHVERRTPNPSPNPDLNNRWTNKNFSSPRPHTRLTVKWSTKNYNWKPTIFFSGLFYSWSTTTEKKGPVRAKNFPFYFLLSSKNTSVIDRKDRPYQTWTCSHTKGSSDKAMCRVITLKFWQYNS